MSLGQTNPVQPTHRALYVAVNFGAEQNLAKGDSDAPQRRLAVLHGLLVEKLLHIFALNVCKETILETPRSVRA
jgi:hypothetical protein